MSKEDILKTVAEVLARQFNIKPETVTRDTSANDVDGWDSISHVYVILEIERRFEVQISTKRAFQLENVGDLTDLLAEIRIEL